MRAVFAYRLLSASLLAALSAGASAGTEEPLAPSSRWVVDFAEAQCVASREYGVGEDKATFIIKAPPQGDVLQLAVLQPGRRRLDAEQLDGSVAFGAGSGVPVSVLVYTATDKKNSMFLFNLDRETARSGLQQGEIQLSAKRELRRRFKLTATQPLMKAMDDCVTSLRRYWNVKENEQAPELVRERAKASLAPLFNSDDYPRVSAMDRQSGTVGAVLLVDEQGKVADCTLVQTSGVAALDAQTCFVIRTRAKYKPAVGLDGKPARDVDFARIRWLMP